jgi:hypothetical protein
VSREQRAGNRDQSGAQRTENREQRAESTEHKIREKRTEQRADWETDMD